LQIRISSISINAAPTNCIFFEVEDFRIWHSVENLSESANLLTFRAHKKPDGSPTSFCGHEYKLDEGTDKLFLLNVFIPFTLEVLNAPVVFKIENLDFESTFADSHTDLFAFNNGIFESEFMFTL
jgi:hypothetical protein